MTSHKPARPPFPTFARPDESCLGHFPQVEDEGKFGSWTIGLLFASTGHALAMDIGVDLSGVPANSARLRSHIIGEHTR